MHTTNGGPGRWNNQSMVRLDNFVSGICKDNILDDVTFELFAHDKEGKVKKIAFPWWIFNCG